MTEFQELIKDAPKFASMERGELVAYAYGMYAAGGKTDAENAKLRELADAVKEFVEDTHCEDCPCRRDCDDNNRIFCANDFSYHAFAAMRELGVEVTGDEQGDRRA